MHKTLISKEKLWDKLEIEIVEDRKEFGGEVFTGLPGAGVGRIIK